MRGEMARVDFGCSPWSSAWPAFTIKQMLSLLLVWTSSSSIKFSWHIPRRECLPRVLESFEILEAFSKFTDTPSEGLFYWPDTKTPKPKATWRLASCQGLPHPLLPSLLSRASSRHVLVWPCASKPNRRGNDGKFKDDVTKPSEAIEATGVCSLLWLLLMIKDTVCANIQLIIMSRQVKRRIKYLRRILTAYAPSHTPRVWTRPSLFSSFLLFLHFFSFTMYPLSVSSFVLSISLAFL